MHKHWRDAGVRKEKERQARLGWLMRRERGRERERDELSWENGLVGRKEKKRKIGWTERKGEIEPKEKEKNLGF